MTKSLSTILIAFWLTAVALVQPANADYKQAVVYYNAGNYQKAIQELKPILDQNADWEPGHRMLGLCYLNLKNYALAVSSFQRAIELKSKAFSTYYGLGLAFCSMQNYEKCISALNQAEPLAGSNEKAKLSKLRGSAYFELNQYSRAADDLTDTIRDSQSDWMDYYRLGISYLNMNRTEDGIQALEKALSMKPGQRSITDPLGKAYLKKGAAALAAKQYGSALQTLLKAREYDPKNGYVYYNLGEAYLFEKRYPEAEKAYSQTAELLPGNMEVYVRIGLVYEKQKKWDLALNAYKKAEQISPSKDVKAAIARVNENKKK